jgi:hypothetical protein
MTIVGAACCRKDGGELLRPESESLLGFDQAGCFWAAGTSGFKPASRASLSARNRAVFSRVADCVFGHCLLPLSQLLFLFLENRFGAVTRRFSVSVQSRYSCSSEPARRTDFPA